jgi:uncharacterized protein
MPQYLSPGVYVEEVPSAVKAIAGVGTSTAGFIGLVPDKLTFGQTDFEPVSAGVAKLCTNFTEFKKFFGDFSADAGQSILAHAVYGFFNNGGSRCYVARLAPAQPATPPTPPAADAGTAADASAATEGTGGKGAKGAKGAASAAATPPPPAATATRQPDLASVLVAFEAIDEIAIVAAPGFADKNSRDALITHCRLTKSRFAILDTPKDVGAGDAPDLTLFEPKNLNTFAPPNSDYAAVYFPWIEVFDPATRAANPKGDGMLFVPPSGHVAGVYARVDAERGVHKAPANEVVLGALGLRYALSKSQQDGLNPRGINSIRSLNGNIRIWGARTAGGDDNADLKYVNVRRTLIYLRGSIESGTQWVVFEPNTPALWQQITRNVTAFLTNVWRSGALFGNTPAEAFYVKCDAENNPPELRELGQVVTEVGVAIVRPAEFVIFRISQFSAPGK